MFASEKKGDVFVGILRYTLDERPPVFTKVDDCSGRAAELRGSLSATLRDRLVKIGYVVLHVILSHLIEGPSVSGLPPGSRYRSFSQVVFSRGNALKCLLSFPICRTDYIHTNM